MDLVSVCCDLDSCAAEAHSECDGEEIDLFAMKVQVMIIALIRMEMIVFCSQDHKITPHQDCNFGNIYHNSYSGPRIL